MGFDVRIRRMAAGGRTGEVVELIDKEESVFAEVWPHWGFNCLRWQLRQEDGRWGELLDSAPDWESNPIPTRSGHPILFPFPGRMRDGRFPFDGRTYALPLNDSTGRHAIHGFTPRNPWRVIASGADERSAYVSGAFSLKRDLPAAETHWPVDFTLVVTYRLFRDRLRVEARVENLERLPLPFGLGYHGYFRLPGVPDSDLGEYRLQSDLGSLWEANENVPTGSRIRIPTELDFRQTRPIGDAQLDHVFRLEKRVSVEPDGLVRRAELTHPVSTHGLQFHTDPAFGQLVLFTPPHRRSVAIEPYTCAADAANLAARGIDSGWIVLPPGGLWAAAVEYLTTINAQ